MIKVENLNVSYYGKEVVKDVSFSFEGKSLIGIIGPNGAGKSTMIKAMIGLIDKDQGQITINNEIMDKKRKKVAYVPQKNDLDWNFPINVFDTVLMGTYPSLGLFRRAKEKEKSLVRRSLERVGMIDYAQRQIGELSGGQQQRVFLARALAQGADILFLDEPFAGIDAASEEKIIQLLRKLKEEGKTIFVVNHDLSKVESYFDNLIIMNKNLVEAGSVEEVFTYEIITKAFKTDFASPFMKIGLDRESRGSNKKSCLSNKGEDPQWCI